MDSEIQKLEKKLGDLRARREKIADELGVVESDLSSANRANVEAVASGRSLDVDKAQRLQIRRDALTLARDSYDENVAAAERELQAAQVEAFDDALVAEARALDARLVAKAARILELARELAEICDRAEVERGHTLSHSPGIAMQHMELVPMLEQAASAGKAILEIEAGRVLALKASEFNERRDAKLQADQEAARNWKQQKAERRIEREAARQKAEREAHEARETVRETILATLD